MKKLLLGLLTSIILLFSVNSYASHMFGGDLYYTYIGGNNYRITLAIYGDCSGGAFPSLHTSTGYVDIYRDTIGHTGKDSLMLYASLGLPSTDTAGTEVSPVCPGEINNTKCNGGTLPGIKRFIFQADTAIPPYTKWVIIFNGNLTSSSAGRSGSITNLVAPATLGLVDTLNNSLAPNSSAQFTTIATPFFCINQLYNYNPGGVDADGDSLTYKLVPALIPPSSYETYVVPYSGTNPLGVAAGTFSFNPKNGQIQFKPNILQKSVVVEQVSKYRGGVLVGTSMREMTFVVLSCSNPPPSGSLTNLNGATASDSTSVKVCQSQGDFSFNITLSNPSGANVTVLSAGVPAGATSTILNNNSINPKVIFAWNVSNVTPGYYTFYVTLKDDNCPLNSNVTSAYTIQVLENPKMFFQQLTPAACHVRAKYLIYPVRPVKNWSIKIYKFDNQNLVDSVSGLKATDTLTDSVYGGKYYFNIYNENNCFQDSVITIQSFPDIVPHIAVTQPSCFGYRDGKITFSGTGGAQPLKYYFQQQPDMKNGVQDSLLSGTFAIRISDSNNCIFDTVIKVYQPNKIVLVPITTPNDCDGKNNGTATVNAYGGTPPYTYLWQVTPQQTGQNINGLSNGVYTTIVTDSHLCKDSIGAKVNFADCCKPFVPTAFTPNGDGVNDIFRIKFSGDVKLESFTVYNRFGQLVYLNNVSATEGWDGRYKGQPQEMGTYYYFIKFFCGNNFDHEIEYKGDLTLIR
ncbi:MAG: gliding motility-associated C-terminal domain-containing protein [Taibaiella sp.]|nr:gliding motility-associated C-terminal domain-containing protein [Taibaiella sp.]